MKVDKVIQLLEKYTGKKVVLFEMQTTGKINVYKYHKDDYEGYLLIGKPYESNGNTYARVSNGENLTYKVKYNTKKKRWEFTNGGKFS